MAVVVEGVVGFGGRSEFSVTFCTMCHDFKVWTVFWEKTPVTAFLSLFSIVQSINQLSQKENQQMNP